MTTTKTPQKAAPRKTNGQRKTPPRQTGFTAAQEADWTLLPAAEQIRRSAWLFEELKYSVRVAFAQLALQNPQVQQQLAARLAQQGGTF
jgi:hypothetical protein